MRIQDIVKSLFNDTAFNSTYRLGAINSINWARILAQIVYYFSTYYALRPTLKPNQCLQFIVPTGNFGDILAGFYAYKLGLPMGINGTTPGLVIATNSNDILTRLMHSSFWGGRFVFPLLTVRDHRFAGFGKPASTKSKPQMTMTPSRRLSHPVM